MKANTDWAPFGNRICEKDLDYNIDYNQIRYKVKWLSDMTGFYPTL